MKNVPANELHEIIESWSFLCWDCKNKTFQVIEESANLEIGSNSKGETIHIKVRVLQCDNCKKPTIIGTNAYYSDDDGWAARGDVIPSHIAKMLANVDVTHWSDGSSQRVPKEFVAFVEPARKRDLPTGVSKKVGAAFHEAEKAVDNNMPISAAATIRTTIRLLVESHKITETELKKAVRLLPFDKEYLDALSQLKLIGDHSLHHEEYEATDLNNAIDVLHLALVEYYAKQNSLKKLQKAVSSKSSKIALDKTL
jgi:adenine-specific DNA methylase